MTISERRSGSSSPFNYSAPNDRKPRRTCNIGLAGLAPGSARYNALTRRFAPGGHLLTNSAATAPDLARSVIAVPPLARFPNLELNPAANRALIGHLEEGAVTTRMYGGNAPATMSLA
jgi:hypothetical protein